MDDYYDKIKLYKRDIREDNEGEYTFLVYIGVFNNTVEIKDTTSYSMCDCSNR